MTMEQPSDIMINGDVTGPAVLIVDDDQISVMALERAMSKLRLPYQRRIARDGVEALDILRSESGHDRAGGPFVVFLDINMPRMDGHEFLAELRNDPRLRATLVFVMTSSDARQDIDRAYDRNVSGYFVKGDAFDDLVLKITAIERFLASISYPRLEVSRP